MSLDNITYNFIKNALLNENIPENDIKLYNKDQTFFVKKKNNEIVFFYSFEIIDFFYSSYHMLQYIWLNPKYRNNPSILKKFIKDISKYNKKNNLKYIIVCIYRKYDNMANKFFKCLPYFFNKKFSYYYINTKKIFG